MLPGFETYKDRMLKSCAPENLTTYKADLGAVIDEIVKIREGRPLILRMTDFYIAWHPSWLENGLDEVCTTCIGYSSEAVRQVAEQHGVPVASTMVGLNGKDYMSEFPAGYLKADGSHPSDAGAQFIATLLQQTGYEYAGK
jgi:lysophospholipase L1-like esterase